MINDSDISSGMITGIVAFLSIVGAAVYKFFAFEREHATFNEKLKSLEAEVHNNKLFFNNHLDKIESRMDAGFNRIETKLDNLIQRNLLKDE